jgi:hypothetical protein
MAEPFVNPFDNKKKQFVNPFENKKKPFVNPFEKEEFKSEDFMKGSVIDGGEDYKKITDEQFKYNTWEDFKTNVIKRTYGGAVRDLAQGTIDFTNYLAKKLPTVEENIIDIKLAPIAEPEYFGGSLSRDLLGFTAGLKGVDKASKLTKIPEATNKWIKSIQTIGKGGLAEQVAFSPYEERLSNLVEKYPTFANPLTNYLKAVGTDSEDVARAKMFAEGGILSIPFEALGFIAKGADNVKIKAGDKTKIEDKLKDIKPFSKENQQKISDSKNPIQEVDKIGKEKFTQAKELDEKIGPKPRTLEGVEVPKEISKPSLKKSVTDKVEKTALELLTEGKVARNPNIRLNEQIADLIFTGRINDETFLTILKQNKITTKEFAKFFANNASDAGRTLQSLSIIQAQLNKLNKVPGAKNQFKEILGESDLLDTQGGFWRRLDNIRRGLMVTQLATAVRNFESQITRTGLGVLQKGFDYGIQTLAKIINPSLKITKFADPLEALKGLGNVFRQFNPRYFKQVKKETDKILSYFPKEQDRLFLRFSNDVVNKSVKQGFKGGIFEKIEGGVQLLNIFNKAQEFITRRAVFQSSLAERITANKQFYKNKTLDEIIKNNETTIISKEDIAGAVDDALEATFVKNFNKYDGGYESFANSFINLINKIPFTASLVFPFPRFLMNSIKFHIDFSPLGILNFLSKGERMALKSGDTSKISRAILGTGLLTMGYWLRSQPYAGEKWYEFNVGNRTIDVRALNPFAAYLFVGDLVKRKQEGTLRNIGLKDFGSAFLGVRAGTGLYLVDRIIDATTGQNPKYKTGELIEKFFGKVLSGFAVPLQTFQDFAAQLYPDMAIVKDTSKEPIIGEFKKRIPVPNDYPPVLSATSIEYNDQGIPVARTIRRESPAVRQLTGLTFQAEKNPAEKELDRKDFTSREIFTSTRIPELDQAIKKQLAPRIALGLSAVVESPLYQNLNEETKTIVIKQILEKFKKEAMEKIKNDSDLVPYLMRYKIEKLSKDERRILDSYLGKEYLDTMIKNFGGK